MMFQYWSGLFIKLENLKKDFLKVGIGYRVLGGIKFYERAEIKDAVPYLRIVNQKFDDLALERVIGSKKRYWRKYLKSGLCFRKKKQIMFGRLNNKNY